MEIDSKNMERLAKIIKWRLRKNWKRYVIELLSAIYLITIHSFVLWVLTLGFFYNNGLPLYIIVYAIFVIIGFIVYMTFNHLVLSKIYKHGTLFLIELLLFASVCIIVFFYIIAQPRF